MRTLDLFKNEYNHILKGGSGGNSPRKLKKCKKSDAFPFHVMMWIQIRARGGGGGGPEVCSPNFFLLKWCKLAQSECSKIYYYQPKN